MIRTIAAAASASLVLTFAPAAVTAGAPAERHRTGSPGSAGVGDPYFPLDGNGGYDVGHYDLKIRYSPGTGRLTGLATLAARSTKALSAFNLDFVGLRVGGITVNGRPATWSRAGQELTVRPGKPLKKHQRFTVGSGTAAFRCRSKVPGFLATDDGSTSWVSRTSPRAGSRSTTTRPTRRPTPSTSRCRAGREAVANGDLVSVGPARRLEDVDLARSRADGAATSPR